MNIDYYKVLGLKKNASEKDIKLAFRKLARKFHPDVNQNDDQLKNKFLQVNEAHEVLSNKKSRLDYDEFGEKWKHADQLRSMRSGFNNNHRSKNFDMRDLFSGFGSSNMNDVFNFKPKREIRKQKCEVLLDIHEIYSGTKKMLTLLGSNNSSKNIEVTIPKGVKEGQKIKFVIEDDIQVIATIKIKTSKEFLINGENLTKVINIPFIDMILGTEIKVESFRGSFMLNIPALTQNDQIFRIPNKGLPFYKDKRFGNLLIKIRAELPKEIHDDQIKLFKQLKLNYKELKDIEA
ncbi:MAG: DnaJ C-terminal domain-containing protein [Dehalococcoidia bacterium]